MPTHRHTLLWCLILLSLALDAAVIWTRLSVRATAADAAREAARAVAALRTSTIDYTVRLDRSLPVSFTVPLSASITVPISADLPVDTEFSLSLRTAFGEVPVTVPVKATVPVDMDTVVPVRMAVPVSATVPVSFEAPISLPLGQTSMGQSLGSLQSYLEGLAHRLESGPPAWGAR